MQLLVHRLLDFCQLAFVALTQFTQLGFHHRARSFELCADLLRRLLTTFRQRQPHFPLLARQHRPHLLHCCFEITAQAHDAFGGAGVGGAHGGTGGFGFRARAGQRLIAKHAQGTQRMGLPYNHDQRGNRRAGRDNGECQQNERHERAPRIGACDYAPFGDALPGFGRMGEQAGPERQRR